MEPGFGYFCRAYAGEDVQANVIARSLWEAEQEITRMIRGGATSAHAVQHGWPDHEPVLVASAYGGTADGEMWRYLRENHGSEFDRWQAAYLSKTKILDDRWVVIELSPSGIKEYSAFGKAVRAIWGAAIPAREQTQEPAPHQQSTSRGPTRANLIKTITSKAG